MLAILEAFLCFSRNLHGGLIVESNSSNANAWVSNRKVNPWNFQLHLNEIWILSSNINEDFCHELRSVNSVADALAKQGVERMSPWGGQYFVIEEYVVVTILLYLFVHLCSVSLSSFSFQ